MTLINKSFEEFKKQVEDVIRKNGELKRVNESLRETCSTLRGDMRVALTRMTLMEQCSRNSNLEIKGIARLPNENVVDVVTRLREQIGEPVTVDDIEECHRLQRRDTTAPYIIVQLANRRKRDSILEKARRTRVSSTQLNILPAAPVYVNENLCPVLRRLLALTINRKRECGWNYAWVRDGKIFTRKSENNAVCISPMMMTWLKLSRSAVK
ncbi:unnamed protein product [Ixodes pacificus]